MLFLMLACAAPNCMDHFDQALRSVRATWPTMGAALDNPRDPECVWQRTHRNYSADGMGVALVAFDGPLNFEVSHQVLEQPHDLFASGSATYPSMLFFDQTEDKPDTWPLIGVGYHYDYTPCNKPELACVDPDEFFVHEAGYHRIFPGQDGGMDTVTQDDIDQPLDACTEISHEDLDPRILRIRHGRVWDLHIWFDPEGGLPEAGIQDPWRRWKDAPDPVQIDDSFFRPDAQECGCPL